MFHWMMMFGHFYIRLMFIIEEVVVVVVAVVGAVESIVQTIDMDCLQSLPLWQSLPLQKRLCTEHRGAGPQALEHVLSERLMPKWPPCWLAEGRVKTTKLKRFLLVCRLNSNIGCQNERIQIFDSNL